MDAFNRPSKVEAVWNVPPVVGRGPSIFANVPTTVIGVGLFACCAFTICDALFKWELPFWADVLPVLWICGSLVVMFFQFVGQFHQEEVDEKKVIDDVHRSGYAAVHIGVWQEGKRTGDDFGAAWIENGAVYFSGRATSFVLAAHEFIPIPEPWRPQVDALRGFIRMYGVEEGQFEVRFRGLTRTDESFIDKLTQLSRHPIQASVSSQRPPLYQKPRPTLIEPSEA